MSVLPYPPLHKEAKFVDGTITDRDSNDCLTDDLGYGYELRRQGNKDVLSGAKTFRDSFKEMLDSVHHPYEECIKYLQTHIKLDPGFKEFYQWCKANGIPVIIVSSLGAPFSPQCRMLTSLWRGMAPIIRAVLETLIGHEEASQIEIIANDVKYLDPEQKGTKWEIVYRHPESGFGHDKSKAILPYRDLPHAPTLFFCGDGVSDMSAAAHADLLFAKKMANGDSDLMTYCKQQGLLFVPFTDFTKVLAKVKEVVAGKDFRQVLKEEGN
ncbi:hypothetical protein P7C73_g939, partial [Tremellales sp. Uapishka_1]